MDYREKGYNGLESKYKTPKRKKKITNWHKMPFFFVWVSSIFIGNS